MYQRDKIWSIIWGLVCVLYAVAFVCDLVFSEFSLDALAKACMAFIIAMLYYERAGKW